MPSPSYWGRTKPPPGVGLEKGHPLAVGLVSCLTFAEGHGIPRDVVSGRLGTPSASIAWTTRQEGRGPLFVNASAKRITYQMVDSIANGPYTAVIDARMDWRSSSSFINVGSADGTDLRLHVEYGNPPNIRFNMYGDDMEVDCTAANLSDGSRHFLIARLDAAKLQTFLVNGHQMATTRTATNWFIGDRMLTIGANPANGQPTGGTYNGIWIYNRYLSFMECKSLYAQPWQMFAPPVWRRYFVPAAEGGAVVVRNLAALGVG